MNPPPGWLWPRQNTAALIRIRTGIRSFAIHLIGNEFSSGRGMAAKDPRMSSRTRGTESTTAAIATPHMPSTESSPMVSKARNSTRMVFTTLLPCEIVGPLVRYHCEINGFPW